MMWLALTTCDRFDVCETSINSLMKSDFPEDTHLIIADDCSSDNRVKMLLYAISNKFHKNLTIKIIFRTQRFGCDRNMISTIKAAFEKSSDEYVVTIDSDAIYNPKWLKKLIEAKDSVSGKIGMLSAYDSIWHKPKAPYNDLLNVKADVGGFACMVNRDLIMSPELKTESWDWSYIELCRKHDYLILGTKVSYVQHIGKHGAHSDGSDVYDHSETFVSD